jgi:hypothetical protein
MRRRERASVEIQDVGIWNTSGTGSRLVSFRTILHPVSDIAPFTICGCGRAARIPTPIGWWRPRDLAHHQAHTSPHGGNAMAA